MSRDGDRELRRDEVCSPEVGGVIGEWQRDGAYFRYRIIKRLGRIGGPVVAAIILAAMIFGMIVRLTR